MNDQNAMKLSQYAVKNKEKPNEAQKGFVKGAALLGGMGVVSKVIGAVYTIVCTNIVGTIGMANYTMAFPVYTFLLALSSAGLPVAISKMVSERITLGDYKAAHMVFKTAIRAMIFIGFVTTVLMIAFSKQIAAALGNADASLAIACIAPSLFFVAILSAYRGFFQGMQRMGPTAFSQILEQVGKLIVGLALAYLWVGKGEEYGAAGAILGITFSEVLAFLFMFAIYKRNEGVLKKNIRRSIRSRLRVALGKKLFYLAMPIVIGACALPLVQLADAAIITNTLNGMQSVVIFGNVHAISSDLVKTLYSLLTAYINPIINMPAVISLAFAMSLVPAISSSRARNDELGVSNKSALGLKLSLLVGLPCAIGLYLLATPIIHLLYSRPQGEDLAIAGRLLSIMAFAVLFLTIVQTTTGILQGLGKTYIPVVNLFIGIVVKISCSLIFIRMPDVNIFGAAIGTVACYTVAAVLDTACVIKYAHIKIKFVDTFLKPILAAGVMGLVVFLLTPQGFALNSSRILTIVIVGVAVIVYGAAALGFGVLNDDELKFIPGGNKISRFMNKRSPKYKRNKE